MSDSKWSWNDIPSQQGRVAIVTGANSGIGFATARALAGAGSVVVLACRNLDKGEAAVEQIRSGDASLKVEIMELDLADLASVRNFAEGFNKEYDHLDVLVNNAGVMALPKRWETPQGFEMHFGTNHLGHFALTGLLIEKLKDTAEARVVTVSSVAEMIGHVNFDDLSARRNYNRWRAYGQSKIANLLFTYELQRRFEALEVDALSVAAHPGWTATNLQSHSLALRTVNPIVGQKSVMGSLPILFAATSEKAKGGAYYGPGGFMQSRGYPKQVRSTARSHDLEVAARLWAVSEDLTSVHYLNARD